MRFLLLLLSLPVVGAITGVSVAVTNTQAVLSYKAASSAVCTVEVSESSTYAPLVNDVNTTLFTGSDQDNRTGSVSDGTQRLFVIGKRTADVASDSKRYSRALQANTLHYYRITVCGGDTSTGTFVTKTIPPGNTLGQVLPSDGSGGYAWPSIDWTTRGQQIIDPLTGALVKRVMLPNDQYESNLNQAILPTPAGTNWTTPDNVRVDDSSSATYSAATSDWLYMPGGPAMYFEYATYLRQGAGSINYVTLFMNAWAAGASTADRTVQICLTVDGVACASDMVDSVLPLCTVSCTVSNRFTTGTTTAMQAFWGTNPIPSPAFAMRVGQVNTSGTAVTWVSDNNFGLRWTAGTKIFINSVAYTIASVTDERHLVLTGSAGVQTNVQYYAYPFGFLLRKKSASTDLVSVQFANYNFATGQAARWDTSADADALVGCSPVLVAGPASEQGYHCNVGFGLYWIGATTGTVTKIALANLPSGANWNARSQFPVTWDATDGNTLYTITNNSEIVKAVYTGLNADIGGESYLAALVACGASPCWTMTRLNPTSIIDQIVALAPACSIGTTTGLVGGQSGYLIIESRVVNTNDVLGCMGAFSLTSNTIVSARPSWTAFPSRWATLHGGSSMGAGTEAFWPASPAFSTSTAGGGPWRSKVTSGAIPASSGACPARPADSVIPVSLWPVTNVCSTVTVAGEPCDPSPQSGEPTNPAKCEVPTDGYLQDAAAGDVFSINTTTGGTYGSTEYIRLLSRTGLSWIIQRQLGISGVILSHGANAQLYTQPGTCGLTAVYPCGGSDALWSFVGDPNGTSTTAVELDPLRNGTGHATNRPGGIAWSTVQDTGPDIDGNLYGYYSSRVGSLSTIYSLTPWFVAGNPPFAGITGYGNPNAVDGHPSQPHFLAAQQTLFDSRPYLGQDGATGTSGSPGTSVTGTLYKFTAAQIGKLRRKVLPTWASCSDNPMTDVSTPTTGDIIGGTDTYKYCVAANANECRTGSTTGDVYANCPLTNFKYSYALAAGEDNDELRWITVTDAGAYAHGISEVPMQVYSLFGAGARQLSYVGQRYSHVNVFGNVKSTPLGQWVIAQAPWYGDIRAEALLIKRPPTIPDSNARSTFSPIAVTMTAPSEANRMLIQYGYDATNFYCSSRAETCYATSATINETTPFLYAAELINGSGSTTGKVLIPARPSRIVYWRIIWRASASGSTISTGPTQVSAVP